MYMYKHNTHIQCKNSKTSVMGQNPGAIALLYIYLDFKYTIQGVPKKGEIRKLGPRKKNILKNS